MNKRTRNIITAGCDLAGSCLLIGGCWLPATVQPSSRYRVALAEQYYPSVGRNGRRVIERVAPVATALANAAAQASAEEVDLGALIGTQVEPT
ncbi:MAG: hypothetical protein H6668_19600 [Ardenticatenaceae bacterium]|nr:hypothetical protein [Ardenticatenaceae bacterium]